MFRRRVATALGGAVLGLAAAFLVITGLSLLRGNPPDPWIFFWLLSYTALMFPQNLARIKQREEDNYHRERVASWRRERFAVRKQSLGKK